MSTLWLFGGVRVRIRGMYAARELNDCARMGVGLYAIRAPQPQTAVFSVKLEDFPRLREPVRRAACRLHILHKYGAPFFMRGLYRHAGFLVGIAACLALIWCVTSFVWTLEVTGNRTVPSAAILRAVETYGVKAGARVTHIDPVDVRNRVLCDMPELCWLTVRFHGSHAVVEVRERELPPTLPKRDDYRTLYARTTGLVTLVQVRHGTPLVTKGALVLPGDALVAPYIRYPILPRGWPVEYGTLPSRTDADIYARVWPVCRLVTPLDGYARIPTGETAVRWALTIGQMRVNFYKPSASDGETCDILMERKTLTVGGLTLPFSLIRETLSYTDRVESAQDTAELTAVLETSARARLASAHADVRLRYAASRARVLADALYVTVTGECVEDIGIRLP